MQAQHLILKLGNTSIINYANLLESNNKYAPYCLLFWNFHLYVYGMYMDDHGVPHCHAMYGDYAGSFAIESGECLAGQMPPTQAKKIKSFM
ncbi:MAG: DUF4160 domain-containing protein [Snowella sp.]